MNRFFKQALVSFALIAVSVMGAWTLADAGQLAFSHQGITAEACGGGCHPIPPSCDLHVDPTSMQGTGDVRIYWDSYNASSGTVSNGDTTVDLPGASGDMPVYGVSETTTFIATVYNAYGDSAHCSATVTVVPPPQPPTCTLHVDPSSLVGSGDVKLIWDSHNAVSGTIDHGVGDLQGAAGDVTIHNVSQSTTYTATFKNSVGDTVHCHDSVTVTPPPPQTGCIQVLKETFDTNGSSLTPVTQFSFTLDGITTIFNDANGHATFTNVTPNTTHTVTEGNAGPNWSMLSVTPAGGKVYVPAGSVCAVVTFKNKQVVQPPQNGCIVVHKQTLDTNGNNLTPVTQFSFQLDGGATVQNDANGNAVFSNVTPGTHSVTELPAGPTWHLNSVSAPSGQVTVQSGSSCAPITFVNQQVVPPTDVCPNITGVQTSVPSGMVVDSHGNCITPQPAVPVCHLSISSPSIHPGDPITLSWTSSNVTVGSIDNNVGNAIPVASGSTPANTIFPSSSTTYTGTFGNGTATTTCTVAVTVITSGGGCVPGTCPGGLNQPNVSLFQQPNEQPLAFVSLAEIPYTGFEAGPALTAIFWIAIALLSALIAYGVVGKDATRFTLAYVLGTATGIPFRQDRGAELQDATEEDNKYGRPYPISQAEEARPMSAARASVAAPAPAAIAPVSVPASVSVRPVATPVPTTNPTTLDVIESRAHAAGVLMSPEAAALATELSPDQDETLRTFGEILDDAVRTIPREDGWIMLTTERLRGLSAKHPVRLVVAASAAPSLAPIDESAASAFAGAVASGDRENAFAIVRSLEHDGVKPTALMTATATVLDKLYRARRGSQPAPDALLAAKASDLSDEELERLIGVFTHALDHVYASPFTGVKLALAQAFEVVG